MDLSPQEQKVVRRFGETKQSALSVLLRSSLYCIVLAGLFLWLALARNEPRYAIGIFGMFVLYLAIRVYTARRVSGVMPRILQRYEFRIAELEARLQKTHGIKPEELKNEPMA